MSRALIASFVWFAVVATVCAQGTTNLFGIQSKTVLIGRPEVKKEIGLTRDQEKALRDLLRESGAAQISVGASIEYPLRAIDLKIEGLLDSAQKSRLHALFLQANGECALRLQEEAKRLGLDDERHRQIREIAQRADADCLERLQKSQGRINTREFESIRTAANAKIRQMLSAEQLDQWKRQLGAEFKFVK